LVTGASSGFRKTVAQYVLKNGDVAVVAARKREALSFLSSQYSSDRLCVFEVDVTKEQNVVAAFAKTKEVFQRLDVVFNNASYGALGEVEGTPDDVARSVFEVNFWGNVNVTKAVKFFRKVNAPGVGGRLVQISSASGIRAFPVVGFYAASKHAIEGLSESLARELDPKWNIKITILEPSGFKTSSGSYIIRTPIHPAYDDPSQVCYRFRKALDGLLERGDPDKAARVIYQLAAHPEPPFRLPLGKDALEVFREKLSSTVAEVEKFASWSDDLALD
ncbi:hypothetical protein PILCRDRAFT_74149, partial [Piloderma croceum F 1598]